MNDPTEHLAKSSEEWPERWRACLAGLTPSLPLPLPAAQPHAPWRPILIRTLREARAREARNARPASPASGRDGPYAQLVKLLEQRLAAQPFLLPGLVPPLFSDLVPAACRALREQPWLLPLLPPAVAAAHPAMVDAAVASHGVVVFMLDPAARAACSPAFLHAAVAANPERFACLPAPERTRGLCMALLKQQPQCAPLACAADGGLPLRAAVEEERVYSWEAAIARGSPALLAQVPPEEQVRHIGVLEEALLRGPRDAAAALAPAVAPAAWAVAAEHLPVTSPLRHALLRLPGGAAAPALPWAAALAGAAPLLPVAVALAAALETGGGKEEGGKEARPPQGLPPWASRESAAHQRATLRDALAGIDALACVPIVDSRPLLRLVLFLRPELRLPDGGLPREHPLRVAAQRWRHWLPLLSTARAAGLQHLLVPFLPPLLPRRLHQLLGVTPPLQGPACGAGTGIRSGTDSGTGVSPRAAPLLTWQDLLCLPASRLLSPAVLPLLPRCMMQEQPGLTLAQARWQLLCHVLYAGLRDEEVMEVLQHGAALPLPLPQATTAGAADGDAAPEGVSSAQEASRQCRTGESKDAEDVAVQRTAPGMVATRTLDTAAALHLRGAWMNSVPYDARTAFRQAAVALAATLAPPQREGGSRDGERMSGVAWLLEPLAQRVAWLQRRLVPAMSLSLETPTQELVWRRLLGLLPTPPASIALPRGTSRAAPWLPRCPDNVAYMREQAAAEAVERRRQEQERQHRLARRWLVAASILTCGLLPCMAVCCDECGPCRCSDGPGAPDCSGLGACCSLCM